MAGPSSLTLVYAIKKGQKKCAVGTNQDVLAPIKGRVFLVVPVDPVLRVGGSTAITPDRG